MRVLLGDSLFKYKFHLVPAFVKIDADGRVSASLDII